MSKNKGAKRPTIIASTDKLRILCLHGYRQNGDSFRRKIGSFRKVVQKYAEFEFISAPHKVQSDDSTAQGHSSESNSDDGKLNGLSEESELSWWFNKDDRTFRGTNVNGPAIGFEESVRLVEETWKTKGPFHGLLGFSQGASFAALLCSLSARGMSSVKPRFVILASGFRSGSLAHKNYYEDTLLIPSLHIMGTSDEIIPIDMSQSLASIFEEPELVEHPGGHYFPSSPAQKPIYINFISDGLQDYLEERELETAKELKMEIKNGSSDESD